MYNENFVCIGIKMIYWYVLYMFWYVCEYDFCLVGRGGCLWCYINVLRFLLMLLFLLLFLYVGSFCEVDDILLY